MASDGLLFPIFSKVSSQSLTPIYSTIIGGILAALMALFFDLLTLVEMLSIGTLIAYTQVALAVLISRYELDEGIDRGLVQTLASIIFIIVALCCISIYSFEAHDYIDTVSVLLFSMLVCFLIIFVYHKLHRRTQKYTDASANRFLTPCVPWLPVFSIFCNLYLMLKLSFITWIRFILWMILGLSIYFFYGIRQAGKIRSPVFI
jgi:amino acid transporter